MNRTKLFKLLASNTPRVLTGTARFVLSVVLLGAALGKLLDPSLFLKFVSVIFGVGVFGAKVFFLLTVCLEALLGGGLLLMGKQPWIYLSTGVLFLLFAGVVAYAIIFDVSATCGCFGALLEAKANNVSLIRNVVLAAIALFLTVELRNMEKAASAP